MSGNAPSAKPRPVLLMLHGFLGTGDDWHKVKQALAHLSCGFELLSPDLPGHGLNPLPCQQYDFDGVCDALLEYLDSQGVRQFHLLGYSLGGRLALHLARRCPERLLSLTLEACHPGLKSDKERHDRLQADSLWANRLQHQPLRQFLTAWYAQGVFAHLSPAEQTALALQRSQHHLPSQRQALTAMYLGTSLGVQADLSAIPATLACPVCYVVGEKDTKFTALAKAWQQQAGFELVSIAGAGHNSHAENPHDFARALNHALSEAEGPAALNLS